MGYQMNTIPHNHYKKTPEYKTKATITPVNRRFPKPPDLSGYTHFKKSYRTSKHKDTWASNLCNNCGKTGHHYNLCKSPTTSNGIILYRRNPSTHQLEYLSICRKNTFGYSDFIRGNYTVFNMHKFGLIVDEMTLDEKNKILNTDDFTLLWADMWNVTHVPDREANQNNKLCKKYNAVKAGIVVGGNRIILNDIITNSQTSWNEPEWEFPKGRRIAGESDLKCALREFEEETGIRARSIKILANVAPLNEVFTGSNLKSYQNTYFVAHADAAISNASLENYQKAEVSSIEWKTFDECMNDIRPYNVEKKEMLTNINTMLQSYNCLEF